MKIAQHGASLLSTVWGQVGGGHVAAYDMKIGHRGRGRVGSGRVGSGLPLKRVQEIQCRLSGKTPPRPPSDPDAMPDADLGGQPLREPLP